MKNLYDAQLTDGLPEILTAQPWVQALGYAVRVWIRKLLDYADACRAYAIIDTLGGDLLDVLAVELRVPYYDETYSDSVKRTLVKDALMNRSHAGTSGEIERVCAAIFGDAEVSEWWEYGDEPGYYKVTTTNPEVNSGDVTEFTEAAASVKRLSQWLRTVELQLMTDMNLYVGMAVSDFAQITLKMEA